MRKKPIIKRQTGKYIGAKIGQLVLTLFFLSLLVFFVARLSPGDPLKAYYGEALEKMPQQQLVQARERLGLNQSLPVQYVKWSKAALQGDFGISYQYKQPAIQVIGGSWGNTMLLAGAAFVFIFVLGLLLAIFCVRHEGRWVDRLIRKIGVALNSIPEFFVALLLILLFSVWLGILPISGTHSLGESGFFDKLWHLVLPVSVMVLSHIWYCTYLMRNKLSEEVGKEYVLLCRAKGLSENRILYGHCLKNIMPAVVSIMAIFLPHLLGGAYVIEIVFSRPGLGNLGFESAKYSDYNLLMLICLITGAVVIIANMTAQAINERLDIRIGTEKLNFRDRQGEAET